MNHGYFTLWSHAASRYCMPIIMFCLIMAIRRYDNLITCDQSGITSIMDKLCLLYIACLSIAMVCSF